MKIDSRLLTCIFYIGLLFSTGSLIAKQDNSENSYLKVVRSADSLLDNKKYEKARTLYNQAGSIINIEANRYYFSKYKTGYSYLIENEGFLALAYFTDIQLSFNPQTKFDSAFILLVNTEIDLLTIEVLSPGFDLDGLIKKYFSYQSVFSAWESSRFEFLIGEIFFKRLKYNSAIRYFKNAISYAHSDTWLKENAWFNVGNSYLQLQDFQNTIEVYLFILNNRIKHLGAKEIYLNLGMAYMLNKDFDPAINCFEKSLNSQKLSEVSDNDILLYINIGNCYLLQDKKQEAFLMFDKANKLSVVRNLPAKDKILTLIAKADYYNYSKDYKLQQQQLAIALKSLDNTDEDFQMRSSIIEKLTVAYYENREYKQAIQTVNDFIYNYKNLSSLGIINSIGWTRYQSIIQYRALAAYMIWKTDSSNTNNLRIAYNYFQEGMEAINSGFASLESEKSMMSELSRMRNMYTNTFIAASDLYAVTREKNLLDEMFLLIENSKANLFRLNLRNSKAITFSGLPDELIKLEGDLKSQIAWLRYNLDETKEKTETARNIPRLRNELAKTQLRYDSLINVLEVNYPKFYASRYNPLKYNINLIQKKLQNNQIVIDYYLADSRLFVLCIEKKQIVFKEIITDKKFESNIIAYHQMLNHAAFDEYSRTNIENYYNLSHAMYRVLVLPIIDRIRDKRLVIIPDKELCLIPFESLVTDTNFTIANDYSTFNYFISTNAVTILYSIDQFFTQNKYLNRGSNFLGFAPSYNTGSLNEYANLPGAEKEVLLIDNFFKGKVFIDSSATKRNFLTRCKDFEIVHLALHTEINDKDPLYSKLLFSSGKLQKIDPMYTYEIYGTKLHAKLLILSGCNTGYGKLEYGEGVMNLARSFFYNGVDNVIVTQWSVVDKSSAALMNYFYFYLKKGLSADIALQKAKLDFLKYEDPLKCHPYYWSGYISIGRPVDYKNYRSTIICLILVSILIVGKLIYFYTKQTKNQLK